MRFFRRWTRVLVVMALVLFIVAVSLLGGKSSSSSSIPAADPPTDPPTDLPQPRPRTLSMFEREHIMCPNRSAPYDGLGTRKRLPQAILIGVMKGGTGAIKHFLRANPEVSVIPNEFHHFSNEKKYQLGLEAYRQSMPESTEDQVTFEGSPGYFPTWKSVRRMYAMDPCVKLVVTIIDPAERVVSHYAHTVAKGLDMELDKHGKPKPFHDIYIDNQGKARDHALGVSESMYGPHFQRWLEYFPPERIHVVDGAILKTEPWVEIIKLEKFLGVKVKAYKTYFEYRSDGKVFCHKKVGCLAKSKGRAHPEVSESDMASLRAMFQSSNNMLFELIGRKLSWA